MVQITESVHPRSLSFANQRKVVILRDQGFAWNDITGRVVNLQGASPSEDTCQKIYKEFNRRKGRRVYKYHRCGQKPGPFPAGSLAGSPEQGDLHCVRAAGGARAEERSEA